MTTPTDTEIAVARARYERELHQILAHIKPADLSPSELVMAVYTLRQAYARVAPLSDPNGKIGA